MHDVSMRPISPYLMPQPPTSPGRALLARALSHYCALAYGLSDAELAAGFAGEADAAVANDIALSTRLLGELLARGDVRAWARAKGGGEPVAMKASLWELDDFTYRFATSAVDPARPFEEVEPTHWIFVHVDEWNAMVERVLLGGRAPAEIIDASRPRDRTAAVQPAMAFDREPPGPGDALDRLLRLPEVKERVGLSKATIYRRMGQGGFPQQIPLSDGAVVWRDSEIAAWIASQG